jgi:acetyltransferase
MRNHASVTLRPVRPDDVGALREFLQGLSMETRYRRFHQAVHSLTDAQWRYLTRIDGHDHVALVACIGPRIVAVARFIRDRERHDVAVVAIVVHDELHRCGVGRRLGEALLDVARAKGIRTFRAFVSGQNVAVRRLIAAAGLDVVTRGDMLEASLPDLAASAE